MSKVISARIPDNDAELLLKQAKRAGRKPGELAARYLSESLVAERFPGIVFVEGPAGRRAHLAGSGLDVWEVAMLVEDGVDLGDIAREHGVSVGLLNTALRYAGEHSDEIGSFMPTLDVSL